MHVSRVRQHFVQRAKRSFGYWNELRYFLERSVFRAGLTVQCPTCGHRNWFDLDAISYEPICARCLKRFKFAQGPAELGRVQSFYRVVGPFAALDYARGGYAVALTLRCIAERLETAMTWSTGLVLDNLNCEIDFVAWHRRSSMLDEEADEPNFLIGEAKSFGKNAIDEDAVATLRKVAVRFPGAFLVVSSLKQIGEYSPSEILLLTDLARWGRARTIHGRARNPLIVLTATELFAQHGITQAWKEIGVSIRVQSRPPFRFQSRPL
jgi:DNA-directed RNA polymerase subunit RPC12/RpoP